MTFPLTSCGTSFHASRKNGPPSFITILAVMFVAEQETASSAVMESSRFTKSSAQIQWKQRSGKTLKTSSKHFMNLDPTLVYSLKTASSKTKFLSQLLLLLIRKRSFSMKPHNRALPDKAAYNSSSKEKVLDSPETILKNPQNCHKIYKKVVLLKILQKQQTTRTRTFCGRSLNRKFLSDSGRNWELDWELVSGSSEFDYSELVYWQIGRRSCGENDDRLTDGWIDSMTIQNYSCCTCTTKQRRWWQLWHSNESSDHLAGSNQNPLQTNKQTNRLSTRALNSLSILPVLFVASRVLCGY